MYTFKYVYHMTMTYHQTILKKAKYVSIQIQEGGSSMKLNVNCSCLFIIPV